MAFNVLENIPLFQIVATILISIISAVGAWGATRSKGKVDIQAAMNTGFVSLTERQNAEWDRLAAERDRIAKQAEERAARLEALEAKLDKLETERDHAIERNSKCDDEIKVHKKEIAAIKQRCDRHKRHIERLYSHVNEMEVMMREKGIVPPSIPTQMGGIVET